MTQQPLGMVPGMAGTASYTQAIHIRRGSVTQAGLEWAALLMPVPEQWRGTLGAPHAGLWLCRRKGCQLLPATAAAGYTWQCCLAE